VPVVDIVIQIIKLPRYSRFSSKILFFYLLQNNVALISATSRRPFVFTMNIVSYPLNVLIKCKRDYGSLKTKKMGKGGEVGAVGWAGGES
jgi:hypothetical protein